MIIDEKTPYFYSHTLANGMRVVFKPENCTVSYCGIAINTGSRDEIDHEQGMAHFIEHMLFKGTKKRRSAHIINRLEHVGGELNAFTSKEETVVYAAVLNEYTERAIELIADISLHSTFPQKEIDKEVIIILDEIQSYRDTPSELIFDDFEDLLFGEHQLGHNILGKAEVLQQLTTEKAFDYVNRQYLPNEMVLFVTGKFHFKQIIRWAEKYLSIPERKTVPLARVAPTQYIPQKKIENKNTNQVHYILGNIAYSLFHQQKMGMYLLTNILGGPGMNSLLNLSLREKHGLVYNVESSFQPFTDTGMWTVYFGCDPDNAQRCEDLVYSELAKLRDQKISESALKKYKLQLMGQMAIGSESKENMALSIGKSFLRYNKIDNLETARKNIEAITAEQLQEIAQTIFKPDHFSTLIYK
jgi:predicted Zn-dependent peptidase